jgi:hypothetical protein
VSSRRRVGWASIALGMGSLFYGLSVARWRRLLRLLALEEET